MEIKRKKVIKMGELKGKLIEGEYAYRISNINKNKYNFLHGIAKKNNVVFSPTFNNPKIDKIDMATWYFGVKKDLNNFLKDISLLN